MKRQHAIVVPGRAEAGSRHDAHSVSVRAILAIVHERTGVDFSGYRPGAIERRIANRMLAVGSPSAEHYLEHLRACASEPLRLLERLTIKVSRFYRHRPCFDELRARVIPQLAAAHGRVRVWSAGCGCGEEAYTLAMLLDEAGVDGVIVGSDICAAALEAAHAGEYAAAALAELPPDLAARYLEPQGDGPEKRYRVREALRERVRLVRHDLTAHAALPGEQRFELVSCRNLLIYLQRSLQEHALRRLCAALAADGVLCLGEAEWPTPGVAATLVPLSHRTRLFRARGAALEAHPS